MPKRTKWESAIVETSGSLEEANQGAYERGWTEPLLILTPGHAELLVKDGLSKSAAKQYLYDRLGFPASQYPPCMRRERMDRVTRDGVIRPVRRPEDIMLVVAGGPEPFHATFVPTFGDTWAVTKRISV